MDRRSTPTAACLRIPVRDDEIVARRRLRGLRVVESIHARPIPSHAHSNPNVTIVLDGGFEETYPHHAPIRCERASVLVRPPGERHANRFGPLGARHLTLEILPERLPAIRQATTALDHLGHLRNGTLTHLGARLVEELHHGDEASALALEGLALELIATVARLDGRRDLDGTPAWLQRGYEALRDRFRESDLEIRQLAAEVGVHPVHFTRAFRRRYGATPGTLLRQMRVEWAADELGSTERPIADIALDAGFADQSHFGRHFRRQLGRPPAAWRRERLGGRRP
ncbi:MAG: helix-turn-helix transcriptional regulator [Acidobacteriota bacterium]